MVQKGWPAEQEFESFYEEHWRLVFTVARRILRSTCDAEEVVQLVFLAAWLRPPRVVESPGAWLATVTAHASIDYLRRLRRFEACVPCPPANFDADDVPSRALAHMQIELVLAALERLPRVHREVLIASFFSGETQREIARSRGVALGTLKSQIRRAIIALRSCAEAEPSMPHCAKKRYDQQRYRERDVDAQNNKGKRRAAAEMLSPYRLGECAGALPRLERGEVAIASPHGFSVPEDAGKLQSPRIPRRAARLLR